MVPELGPRSFQSGFEIRREGRIDIDPLPREGMLEREPRRVEELALEVELARPAVDRIARDRELDRGEMDADLVRPPGLEADVEERMASEQFGDLEVRDGIARRIRVERMTHGVAAVAPDRRLDPAGVGAWPPHDEREVVALELASSDEGLETLVCLVRTRDDHQTG